MNEPRDALVGDALRRLDVPGHAPDFWTELESRLGVDDAGADGPPTDRDEETTVVGLESSRAGQRRAARRTPLLAVAAAVAVVVALVVGVAVLGGGGDDESQLDVADDPADTTETTDPDVEPPPAEDDASTDTTETPQTTTTVPEAVDEAEAEQTAASWIETLSTGDIDGAYDQLDDASRSRLDRTGFQDLSSGLLEGAADFAQPGITRAVTAIDAADASFAVVAFTGDVEREGMIETASYPVVVTPTGVHFVLDGPQLELDPDYARGSGTTLASPLELLVSESALVWVWVHGAAPEPLEGRGPVSLDVEAIGGPGTNVVHLVALEGGVITARSYTVVVP